MAWPACWNRSASTLRRSFTAKKEIFFCPRFSCAGRLEDDDDDDEDDPSTVLLVQDGDEANGLEEQDFTDAEL